MERKPGQQMDLWPTTGFVSDYAPVDQYEGSAIEDRAVNPVPLNPVPAKECL